MLDKTTWEYMPSYHAGHRECEERKIETEISAGTSDQKNLARHLKLKNLNCNMKFEIETWQLKVKFQQENQDRGDRR